MYVKWFCFEVKWSGITVKSLGTKVPYTLMWTYIGSVWLYCGYFIWCVSCAVVVWTGFVMCGCVCVCVCVYGFCNVWMFWYCVGVLVMCTCVYCVLYCLCCVFVLFRLCKEVGCGHVDWIGLTQDRDTWRTLVSAVMNLRVPWNAGNFLTSCKPVSCSGRTLHHGVSK